MTTRNQKGFTLIEVLLVMGLIAILAAIVIIAINPVQQFKQARDTQRWANVNTILNAVHQYAVSNRGMIPGNITTTATEICKSDATNCTGLLDLSSYLTANELYLVSMPIDPVCPGGTPACDANGVGYTLKTSSSGNGRITVDAPQAELATISVTR